MTLAELVERIGHDETVIIMVNQMGYTKNDAQEVLAFELGIIDSDIVQADDRPDKD